MAVRSIPAGTAHVSMEPLAVVIVIELPSGEAVAVPVASDRATGAGLGDAAASPAIPSTGCADDGPATSSARAVTASALRTSVPFFMSLLSGIAHGWFPR